MTHWIMDYETLSNCFVACFEHYKTNEKKVFVVHNLRDDFNEFIMFLQQNKQKREWHISFNGLTFDSQITQHILNNHTKWSEYDACGKAGQIYKYAQDCIRKQDKKEWQQYPQWKLDIGQIDIFKMNHWDNPAKRSSLKWIQYSMDWENILEMPIHHSTEIKTMEEIDLIIEYCLNDVRSTKEIFKRSASQIKLRKALTDRYDINLYSASEPRISKELFAYYLSQKLNMEKREIKNMRTHRDVIKLEDIILPYIKFTSPEFNHLLDTFRKVKLKGDNLKGSFKHTLVYKDVKTDFGLGGVHGARTSGVYKSDDEHVIITSDVVSFYPNLAIRNKWAPAHFPKQEFCDQYEWFFDERKKIPKKDPMNYVYKIILNSTYGLSNDADSFFYDPEFCMSITVNGQLSLMMLYEMIMTRIPGAVAIMQNTDGLETRIPRQYYDEYMSICKEWEQITNLELEHDSYQQLILADVNNYIAVNNFKEVDITTWREIRDQNPHYLFKVTGDKFMYAPVKMKGRFDYHELQLHKNKSKLVVAKGVYAYFINGILPHDYIQTNKNILDYCIGVKSKGDWKQVARYIKDGAFTEDNLQKVNRYYISKKGVKMTKVNEVDGREIQLESGKWLQTLYNKMVVKPKWEDYNINTGYYLEEIESEINNILSVPSNQLKLL